MSDLALRAAPHDRDSISKQRPPVHSKVLARIIHQPNTARREMSGWGPVVVQASGLHAPSQCRQPRRPHHNSSCHLPGPPPDISRPSQRILVNNAG